MSEIRASRVLSSIKKNKKKQTVVLSVTKSEVKTIKKLKKSKKIKAHIKTLKKNFKKQTGQSLKYVMLAGASEKIVKAFEKQSVSVIAKAQKASFNSKLDMSGFKGIIQVDAKKLDKKELKKILKNVVKKSSAQAIPLRECVKAGSVNSFATNAESDVEKTAAMKSTLNTDADTDAETDAEKSADVSANTNASPAPAATTEQTVKAKDESSASSVAVSSVLSIAAIAAAAVFLL